VGFPAAPGRPALWAWTQVSVLLEEEEKGRISEISYKPSSKWH